MLDTLALQNLKEANQLLREELTLAKIRMNESPDHTLVSTMRKLYPTRSFNVKRLAAYCEEHFITVVRVYCAYGKGNFNYPNSVWKAIYPRTALPNEVSSKGNPQ